MISKTGHALLKPEAIDAVKTQLFPLALLFVTPNIHEAQQLSGMEIKTLADARRAAKVIHGFGCKHVLIKGGHLSAERATDLLCDAGSSMCSKGNSSIPSHAWHRLHVRLGNRGTSRARKIHERCRTDSQDLSHRGPSP